MDKIVKLVVRFHDLPVSKSHYSADSLIPLAASSSYDIGAAAWKVFVSYSSAVLHRVAFAFGRQMNYLEATVALEVVYT